jgi:glycosyltransferase involved in cell wall biosynthesis
MADIAFVIDSVGISGGMAVVFEHSLRLVGLGHRITFVGQSTVARVDLFWHRIGHGEHPMITWNTFEEASSARFDYAIATFWTTFFDLHRLDARKYLYFVQSIESRFYPRTDRVLRGAVEATYEVPVGVITEATWIRDYLAAIYHRTAMLVPNGIDKTLFRPDGPAVQPRQIGRVRVLVEGPVDVPFKNVPKTIRLCREAGIGEVWLLTSSVVDRVDGVDRVFSRLPMRDVPAIYRSCDLIVKLSYVEGMFGPPLEMFHCGGTAIVYAVTGHDEYVRHGVNGLVAAVDDDAAVASYLAALAAEPRFLEGLQQGAAATAALWPDWDQSGERFAQAMIQAAEQSTISRRDLRIYSRRIWHLLESHWRENQDARTKTWDTTEKEIALERYTRGLERSLGERDANINALETAAHEQSNHVKALQHVISAESIRIRTLEECIRLIEESTSWKATWPVRRMGKRFPRMAKWSRRLLKAVWWTMTLHLITRLQARRRRSTKITEETLPTSWSSRASAAPTTADEDR